MNDIYLVTIKNTIDNDLIKTVVEGKFSLKTLFECLYTTNNYKLISVVQIEDYSDYSQVIEDLKLNSKVKPRIMRQKFKLEPLY